MNSVKQKFKKLRLTLMLAFFVFVILLITMFLVTAGTILLSHFGMVDVSGLERLPLFHFAIISIILGTVLSIVLSHLPLAPLKEIMSAIDKIADGDYSARIHLRGPEEFRELSDKFNHMAEEIGSVEMLRSDFVNNFSHEFKTPIVSIRGFAKALKWDHLSEEERDEYLDIIINESERLADLSTNVLYLSKIEQQVILTDKHSFNLSEQIRLVIALLDKKLSEKHMQVHFDCGEISLIGNEEMLQQVWINLMDNAIKFSPAHGVIEIQITQAGGKTSVSVSNQGDIIPPETVAHVFEKFYQGDTSHTTRGNGLGLAIVKRIIQLHGGIVTLKQPEPNRIIFEVSLDFPDCAAPPSRFHTRSLPSESAPDTPPL